MTRTLAVALTLGISLLACSKKALDRGDVSGSMWMATIGDTTGSTKGHVLLEFTDASATMIPLFADAMKYVIVNDTIVVFSNQGSVRFTVHGDSLTDESFGWVFHRAR